jgi:CDP-diacylglycerol--glycerol-3-phosphate 3-phosphatidyltransferase
MSPWLQKLPNRLTFLRIFAIPVVIYLLTFSASGEEKLLFWKTAPLIPSTLDIIAAILFGLAACTDILDGYIARKFNIETTLGKLLDPLADKLLVVSTMVLLVETHRLNGVIAVILIVRDLGINAIRLAAHEDGIHIASNWVGKVKTIFLDIGIAGLIVNGWILNIPFHLIGPAFIYLALLASILSAIQYLVQYAKYLKQIEPQKPNPAP